MSLVHFYLHFRYFFELHITTPYHATKQILQLPQSILDLSKLQSIFQPIFPTAVRISAFKNKCSKNSPINPLLSFGQLSQCICGGS